jgi:hypothetical protein
MSSAWTPFILGGSLFAAALSSNIIARLYGAGSANEQETQPEKDVFDLALEQAEMEETQKNLDFYDVEDISEEDEKTNGFLRPEFQTFRQNVVIEVSGENQNKSKSNVSEAESTRLAEYDKHIFILTKTRSTEWEKDILRKVLSDFDLLIYLRDFLMLSHQLLKNTEKILKLKYLSLKLHHQKPFQMKSMDCMTL